ncbi:tat protein [Simian immunodeficiency virus]|uniref:Protein Tat n=1 Tax=Simian immunodeficiency virus agm.vervet (isolate AGM155) TaxID=11727 RepID=TAT_SIVV1|nr:RecName: Full=Protein Tat; AltName: Full=Transactivating regulatory protein [Simian immunodeficiency virus (AGM155 ISOLATE)]AAA91909.1 tat protein [Simian immunodeficiency virus]
MDKGEEDQDVSHQDLIKQYRKPLETCTNKCFCKKCCYHCQFCFLRKGLGITYHAFRTRRKKIASADRIPVPQQSISIRGRDSQTTQESQKKVEEQAKANLRISRKNLGDETRGPVGAGN